MATPISSYRVRYRQTGTSAWLYRGFPVGQPLVLTDLTRGVGYDVEVQSIGVNGLTSEWVSQAKTVAASAALPSWYQSSVFSGSITPSPASGTSSTDGVTGTAPSATVTMATANGTAPVTYLWARDDFGGTDFLIDDPTLAAPTLSIASGTTAYGPVTQRWRCDALDANGLACQALINVTLSRTVAGGLSVSLSPNPAADLAVYPSQPSVTVTPSVTGATGTVTTAWTRVDSNFGVDFSRIGDTFSLNGTGGYAVERVQVWRYTATDDLGTDFEDVEITLIRDV